MLAIVICELGPPEVLVPQQVQEPVAAPGQVLIDVEFANVTFVETQIRGGRAPHQSMVPELPAIPGNGVGGVVAAVGSQVDPTLMGARVVTSTGGKGGYAERVAVPVELAIPVPDGVGLAEAVALLADGRTAVALVRLAAIREAETVLVEAAAGGVGSLLVQLARSAGARVIAAAGGERKLALALELGADVTIDYTRENWTQEIGAPRTSVDVVFDGVGGAIGRAAFELLRPGGRHCAFGMASGTFAPITDEDARERGVTVLRGTSATPQELGALTRAALEQAAAGQLRPVIGQTFLLRNAADAHRAIEARATLGKTLLVAR